MSPVISFDFGRRQSLKLKFSWWIQCPLLAGCCLSWRAAIDWNLHYPDATTVPSQLRRALDHHARVHIRRLKSWV